MQQNIGIIVYANNDNEALDKAESVLEALIKEHVFGGGYSDPLIPMLADSKEGKKVIKTRMEDTRREFMENITELRTILKQYSNEYLFKNLYIKRKTKKVVCPRYRAFLMGQYHGPAIFLYTHDAEGIRTPKTLKHALDKWSCNYKKNPETNPHKDKKVWVVSAEVTY